MHLHFEKSINAKCDCSILSMSWMGKVPEELPEEEGWKLNRTHYYQEGWLATGNLRGIVGVTFTSSHWRKNLNSSSSATTTTATSSSTNANNSNPISAWNYHELPQRTNYNLRGHRSQITLVQWNEPYQKLASCDSSGIIFVWIKFEGRWSIELINDRSTPVTHFSWSHDGRMALICYRDGFVLVGSVAGQRYWSSMLNLNAIITCGLWSPTDQQVFLGTSNAQVIVMDVVHGMMISQVQLPMDSPIICMSWSCEKFKMEENEDAMAEPPPTTPPPPPPQGHQSPHPMSSSGFNNSSSSPNSSGGGGGGQQQQQQQEESASANNVKIRPMVLALAFQNGVVFLMKNYDDIAPIQLCTGMQQGLMMEWSNSGEILAVVGTRPVEIINEAGAKIHEYFSSLHFYNHSGVRVLNVVIPSTQSPVTALTWGHNDKRLFVATGQTIHVGWVAKHVASLQLLCRLTIYKALSDETCVSHLPLPLPVRTLISSLHTQTILSILPSEKDLLEFVSHPPCNNTRLYCTMIRHDEIWTQSPGTVYTLYLEYLGGLIPILKGKRTSKIRPHFVIYSPQGSTADGTFTFTYKAKDLGPGGQQPNKGDASPAFQKLPYQHSRFQVLSDSSDSEDVELCASPRLQRKRHRARLRERERERQRERELEWERSRYNQQGQQQQQQNFVPIGGASASSSSLQLNNLDAVLIPQPLQPPQQQQQQTSHHQLVYNDVLPESIRLAEVTSNIWGTKFKIHGFESFPPNLGSLSYKTSVLHLQPRQMTCIITELTDDIFLNSSSSTNSSGEGGGGNGGTGSHYHSSATGHHHQHHHHHLDEADDMFSIVVGTTSNSATTTTTTSNNYYTSSIIDRAHSVREDYSGSMHMKSRYSTKAGTTTTTTTSKEDESPYVEILPLLAELNSIEASLAPATPSFAAAATTTGSMRRHLVTHAALIERIDDTPPAAAPSISSSPSIPGPSSILSHRGSVHSSPTRRRISWTKLHHHHHHHESSSPPLGTFDASIPSSSSSGRVNGGREGGGAFTNPNTNSPPPVQPIHVRRSISASYLDNVFERTLPVPVDMVSPDLISPMSPPKRLVLIKENQLNEAEELEEEEADAEEERAKSKKTISYLKEIGKSKSWDFAELAKLKQAKASRTLAFMKQHPHCPNCKFPTTAKSPTVENAVQLPIKSWSPPCPSQAQADSSSNKAAATAFPKTPARKPIPPKTPLNTRRRDSNEDRIERLAESPASESPPPLLPPPPPPQPSQTNHQQVPPQTPTLQRRLSNFLTPILRRRDLFSCSSSSSGNTEKKKGGNPNSTCFIPPDSPTHIPKPMSTPTTPAANRKLKTKPGSYLAAASAFFANSPLLSRRKYGSNNNNNNNNNSSFNANSSSGSGGGGGGSGCRTSTHTYRRQHHHHHHQPNAIINSTDEDDDDEIEITANNGFSRTTNGSSNNRRNSAQFSSSSHYYTNLHLAPPQTQAHHAAAASSTFRDLETFQKSQLRQKLRKKKIHNIDNSPARPKRREFVLHNKAPMWNENSQVYQLDFGGRVTQESAKNFQIEFRGKQVMQFGRIDGNAYTLDLQSPISVIQAFGVALANVTQRLK